MHACRRFGNSSTLSPLCPKNHESHWSGRDKSACLKPSFKHVSSSRQACRCPSDHAGNLNPAGTSRIRLVIVREGATRQTLGSSSTRRRSFLSHEDGLSSPRKHRSLSRTTAGNIQTAPICARSMMPVDGIAIRAQATIVLQETITTPQIDRSREVGVVADCSTSGQITICVPIVTVVQTRFEAIDGILTAKILHRHIVVGIGIVGPSRGGIHGVAFLDVFGAV